MRLALSTGIVALTLGLMVGGCSSTTKTEPTTATPQTSLGMVNSVCPFSGEPASTAYTVEYEGQKLGFCCDACVKKFSRADDAGKAALLSRAQ